MAINVKESFKVAAPIGNVWDFLLTPDNIVACMPGATLTEIIDSQHFVGAVKVKIGAISAQYQGSITYQEVDQNSYTMKMLAKGNERGGGTVTGTIETQLIEIDDGSSTEVRFSSVVNITGRLAQVGRGMIDGVSAQIIKKFVGNLRAMLEPSKEPVADNAATAHPKPQQEDSINIFAVVFKVLWDGLRNFVGRLFRFERT
ncbi:MAG: SRPBCC family protein [Gammaproteobacteria bacterium]